MGTGFTPPSLCLRPLTGVRIFPGRTSCFIASTFSTARRNTNQRRNCGPLRDSPFQCDLSQTRRAKGHCRNLLGYGWVGGWRKGGGRWVLSERITACCHEPVPMVLVVPEVLVAPVLRAYTATNMQKPRARARQGDCPSWAHVSVRSCRVYCPTPPVNAVRRRWADEK